MKRSKTSLDFFIFPAISWNANSSIAETGNECTNHLHLFRYFVEYFYVSDHFINYDK